MDNRQTEMALLPPRVEDQELSPRTEPGQGLDIGDFARESFESAVERFKSAGDVEVDPEDTELYNAYRRSLDYLGDMALGGLDLSDAAFRSAVGIVAQALPEDQERRFARDLAGMPEAFLGFSPGRIAAATDEVMEGVAQVGRNLTRRDEMPVLGSNLGNVGVRADEPARPSGRVTNPLFSSRRSSTSESRLLDVVPERYGVDVEGSTLLSFYSPLRSAVEQMPIAREGSTGQTIIAYLNKRAPNVSQDELRFSNLNLDPQRRYTREELLSLIERDTSGFEATYITGDSTLYQKRQRQNVIDPEKEYFEIILEDRNTPLASPELTHFTENTFGHSRASVRSDNEGDYILVDEFQSDPLQRGNVPNTGHINDPEAEVLSFVSNQRDYNNVTLDEEIMRFIANDFLYSNRSPEELRQYYKDTFNLDVSGSDPEDIHRNALYQTSPELKSSDFNLDFEDDFQGFMFDLFEFRQDLATGANVPERMPFSTNTQYVRNLLLSLIAKAKNDGIDRVVIPPVEELVRVRDSDRNLNAAFRQTYVDAVRKAVNIINNEANGTIRVGTQTLEYPTAVAGQRTRSATGTLLDISDFDFDPQTQAARFAEGGAVTMDRQMDLFEEGGLAVSSYFVPRPRPTQEERQRIIEEDRSLISRRADRRAAQREAQENQPEFTSDPIFRRENLQDAATFAASVTPVVGDAMAVQEVYDELQKEDPNYFLIGALGGAAMVGLVPLVGDAAAGAIRAGARSAARTLGRTTERLNDAAARADRRIMTGTIGDLYRSATNRRIGRRASRNAPAMSNDEAARSLRFNDYVYHGTPSYSGDFTNVATIDELGLDSFEPHDFLGFHVGTPSSANQRISAEDVFGPNSNLPTGSGSDGIVKELRARTDQPFTNNGRLWSEEELRDFLTERLDDLNRDSPTPISVPQGMAIIRRELADQGFTHVPYMNNVEDAYSESYIMLIDRAADSPAVLRDSRAVFDPERITERNLGYNKGGMAMERQMDLFEEGGLMDDGAKKDPVSGNDVPAGSMSDEVRDDVPVMLSEGEYVVPADVVRYYGLNFFENLRDKAKDGLQDMEASGRIGGEPMDATPGDEAITEEERMMLMEVMGMYAGGDVRSAQKVISVEEAMASNTSIYDLINDPEIMIGTPTGDVATTPEMKRELLRKLGVIRIAGMAQGGRVQGYQVGGMTAQPYQSPYMPQPQYTAPGLSVFGTPLPTTTPVAPVGGAQTPVTLYSPQGVAFNMQLPRDQQRYNNLISQGYTTQMPGQVSVGIPTQPTAPQQDGGDDYREISETEMERSIAQATTGQSSFTVDELNRIQVDPIGYANSVLDEETLSPRTGAMVGSVVGGPVMGILGGAALSAAQVSNLSKARAAATYARQQGRTADADAIEQRIADGLENAPLSVRIMDSIFPSSGARRFEDIAPGLERLARDNRPVTSGILRGDVTVGELQNASMDYIRNLSGSAREYADSQLRSGYTGTTVGGIAVGNISDGTSAGVVVGSRNADGAPIALKDDQERTVYRDNNGNTYVKSGLFGQRIEYVSIDTSQEQPQVSPAAAPAAPARTGSDSGSDGRFDSGSGGYSGPAAGDTSNIGSWGGDRDGDGVKNWRDFNDGVGANDKNTDGSGSSEGSGKIVCTAMNNSYGFGSYRQAIWLKYSADNLTEYHEKGYHKIFLPLVDRAYNRGESNSMFIRKVLENIARHRTADLRAEMQGKKRDKVGRAYRAVLEPICYIVGRLSK